MDAVLDHHIPIDILDEFSRARFMIAEDEGLLAAELRDRLESLGHEVVAVVDTGEQVLAALESVNPDMILMDIRLKGRMDGVEAATQVKSRFGIPIIYLTAHSDDMTLRRAKRTGPLGYMIKPVREREFRVAVEMALQQAELQRRLHESEERYATTLTSIGDAVIATDPNGLVTFLNPVAEALTSWSKAEAVNQPLDVVFRIIHAVTREPEPSPAVLALLENRIVHLGDQTLLVARDGTEHPVDDSAAPIRNARGGVGGVVLVFRDIAEKKRAEEAIRRAEDALRQSQKMEAVGRLAGGLAHDINNLMTVVIGFGELVLAKLPANHPVWEMVDEMKRAGDRTASLTRQLLTFSHKQLVLPTSLNLTTVVQETIPMLKRLIGADIVLLTQFSTGLGRITADRVQIEQVILNLCLNARDAMPAGGELRLTTQLIKRDPTQATFEFPAGEYIVLSVSDTGEGMNAETRARIFEPFFTTKTIGRGTGLGLATVDNIVRQSGGYLSVSSEIGHGSKFEVYLPRTHGSHDIEAIAKTREVRGGRETILLVDDDDGVRAVSREALVDFGYRIIEARNGEEAIALAVNQSDRIDLLLTDVVMPQMSGRALTEQIQSRFPSVKVLFMSGYNEDQILHKYITDRLEAFIQKPFSPRELAIHVRQILDRK